MSSTVDVFFANDIAQKTLARYSLVSMLPLKRSLLSLSDELRPNAGHQSGAIEIRPSATLPGKQLGTVGQCQ